MEIIITLAINGLTNFLKNKIKPKYGSEGVHIIVFILAIIASAIVSIIQANPEFEVFAKQAVTYLISAVAMYELILKKISTESPAK